MDVAQGTNPNDAVTVIQLNTKRNSMDGLDAIAANGDVSLSSHKITNLAPATLASDAVRFDQIVSSTTPLNQISLATGDVNLNGQKITGLKDCTSIYDAANKGYVDQEVGKTKAKISSNVSGSTTTGSAVECQSGGTFFYHNGTQLGSVVRATG